MRLFNVYRLTLGLFIVTNAMFLTGDPGKPNGDEAESSLVDDNEETADKVAASKKTPEEIAKEIDQAVQNLLDADNLYAALKKTEFDGQVPSILLNDYQE